MLIPVTRRAHFSFALIFALLGGCSYDLKQGWPDGALKDGATSGDRAAPPADGGLPRDGKPTADGAAVDAGTGPADKQPPTKDKPTKDKASPPADLPPPKCGNGKIEPGEQCDGKDLGGKTCKSYGYNAGSLQCAKCKLLMGGCVKLSPSGHLPISVASQDQSAPRIAWSGKRYLVVWSDRRGGPMANIYGARLDAAGNLMDKQGFIIAAHTEYMFSPAVAASPGGFLVTWDDRRGGTYYDIYGARVADSGSVLDPKGIAISTASSNQRGSAVAHDGTNFFVVWTDLRGGSYKGIYGTAVSAGGAVLNTGGVQVAQSGVHRHRTRIAWDGTNYLVVWDEGSVAAKNAHVRGGRISKKGKPVDTKAINICTHNNGTGYSELAYGGGYHLVVWRDRRNASSDWDIYGNRVNKAGKVMDGSGFAIHKGTGRQGNPVVAYTGSQFWVAWDNGSVAGAGASQLIKGARVSTGGALVDLTGLTLASATGLQDLPALARGSGSSLLVWNDQRNSKGRDIYGVLVTP